MEIIDSRVLDKYFHEYYSYFNIIIVLIEIFPCVSNNNFHDFPLISPLVDYS